MRSVAMSPIAPTDITVETPAFAARSRIASTLSQSRGSARWQCVSIRFATRRLLLLWLLDAREQRNRRPYTMTNLQPLPEWRARSVSIDGEQVDNSARGH